MGKKKKKGLGNRLAKMSDEERARYLQHRAAIEEEARRRKEQLISTFMKNKMKKEDGFTRLNIAKINEYWHQILRKIAFRKMRSEILELTDWIKRVVDIKNKIIEKLMIEIDESEEQYEHNFKSHLAFIDQFLDIHKHSQEHYRLDYEIKSGEMFINSMRELNDKKEKSENEFQYLKTIIYGMDVEREKSIRIYKNRTGAFLDDFNTSSRYEHEIMVNSYIKKMDNIWQNIHGTLNEYLSNTAVKRHHYIELKHLDDRNRKEREDNERKIAKYTDTLNSLKSTYGSTREDDEDELETMIEQQKNLTQQYSRLKKRLKKNLDNDTKKFTKLTTISNQTIDKLKKIKSKGQTVLQIVDVCRKYETEEEKTQSWAAQRKKWYGMYNLVEKIAQEQVELEQAKLTSPEPVQQEEIIEIPQEVIREEERFIETRVFMTKSADSKRLKEYRREETPRSAPEILKTSRDSLEDDMEKIREEFLKLKEEPIECSETSRKVSDDSIKFKGSYRDFTEEYFKEGSIDSPETSGEYKDREFLPFREDSSEGVKSKKYMKVVEEYLISRDESVLSSGDSVRSTEGYKASREDSVQSTEDFTPLKEASEPSKEDSETSKQVSGFSKEGSIKRKSSTSTPSESPKDTSNKESVPTKKELIPQKSLSRLSLEGSTSSKDGSTRSIPIRKESTTECSIHSTEKSVAIIKGSIRSREGSVPSKSTRIKGESVRFVDDYEESITKDESIIAEKVLKQMQIPTKKIRGLKEKSKLKIKGEELRVESKEIKRESKEIDAAAKKTTGALKETEKDSKRKKGDSKETKVDLKVIERDSLEIKGLLKGDSMEVKEEIRVVEKKEETEDIDSKRVKKGGREVKRKNREGVKDSKDISLRIESGKDLKESKKGGEEKVDEGPEGEPELEKLADKKPDGEDPPKDDPKANVFTILEEDEENILVKYNYLSDLSDLWWMHNRVESEILDLKEERKKLMEENKLYKNIIRGILEDAILEPRPQKTPKVSKPAPLKSLPMVPQLPNTVSLEF